MAKPERHPWPYGQQWNYYPPHMLNFSKIPYPNGLQMNIDSNENYLSIRCPEPRRPYHVPYTSFTSYCPQENLPGRPYVQPNTLYPPKQCLYRPLPQESINNTYKVTENRHSYAASSNYSLTKDQNPCYQSSWKRQNTSHFQRNPPELDVRHFLATWQDKDDDFVDVSGDSDQINLYKGNDTIPLDCSKRNSNDKNIRNYNDNFLGSQTLNSNSYFVQPYYFKNDDMSLNRPIISEELNNNILHRNNLNYESSNQISTKNFYSNSMKFSSSKLPSCDYSLSYNQPMNHCDINSNQLVNTVDQPQQKDILLDSSERSQYNLASSLESGDLFSDINPRSEEIQKNSVINPTCNDSLQKVSSNTEHCYYSNENFEFSENSMLSDFHSLKDSWDLFSSHVKVKDNSKMAYNPKSIIKVSPQNHYEQLLPSKNKNNATGHVNNNTTATYEGAFNIMPDYSANSSNSVIPNATSNSAQPVESVKPTFSSDSNIFTKLPSVITNKTVQTNTKIRPYQFNEEISSDDIDISIASSGDLLVEEDRSSICCTSVLSFSKMKKVKEINSLPKSLKNDKDKTEITFPCLVSDENTGCSTVKTSNDPKEKFNDYITGSNDSRDESKKNNDVSENYSIQNNLSSVKLDAVDITVLKEQAVEENKVEKDPTCFLCMPTNYFESSDLETKLSGKLSKLPKTEYEISEAILGDCESASQKKLNDLDDNEKNERSSNLVIEASVSEFKNSTGGSHDQLTGNDNSAIIPNDNLLLLAHCSQEYGCKINKDHDSSLGCSSAENSKPEMEHQTKSARGSVIKCSLRWDRIFNVMSSGDNLQSDMSLDLGPAKVELRMPSENCTSNQWKIVEADNKISTSSIVQVKRLILKRKNQAEERIPKMIIKKTEGQEYRSYLKKDSSKAVLHCEKLKIYCGKLSNSTNKQADI